jgi:alkanesulfonate monooxygenase SsuD/methylene tetrahydromethanopterin reductase-like flavin-dependent oxidoreductase (luciferase family)
MQSAQKAEALGYDSVWSADRIIIPWEIKTTYPYSKEATFIVPPDRPFFEPLTCLAFLAGCTETIHLGMSVMVMPYRHPLYWAKIATTIDHLSMGRFIMGVGVGWMQEEFAAMNAPFRERGKISDEQLQLLDDLAARTRNFSRATLQLSMISPSARNPTRSLGYPFDWRRRQTGPAQSSVSTAMPVSPTSSE